MGNLPFAKDFFNAVEKEFASFEEKYKSSSSKNDIYAKIEDQVSLAKGLVLFAASDVSYLIHNR